MIEVRIQRGESESAFAQGFAVACMLLQHFVILRNSQLNRGESLGKIDSRQTNNGVLEHVTSLYHAVNLSYTSFAAAISSAAMPTDLKTTGRSPRGSRAPFNSSPISAL